MPTQSSPTTLMTYSISSMYRRIFGSGIQIPISIFANLGYRFYANHLHEYYNCDWITGFYPPKINSILTIYHYFIDKFHNAEKFNLDDESLFLEFKLKLLNG